MINWIYKEKKWNDGIKHMKKAIVEHPDAAEFYSWLSYFYTFTNKFEKGYKVASKAYNKFPNNKVKRGGNLSLTSSPSPG